MNRVVNNMNSKIKWGYSEARLLFLTNLLVVSPVNHPLCNIEKFTTKSHVSEKKWNHK